MSRLLLMSGLDEQAPIGPGPVERPHARGVFLSAAVTVLGVIAATWAIVAGLTSSPPGPQAPALAAVYGSQMMDQFQSAAAVGGSGYDSVQPGSAASGQPGGAAPATPDARQAIAGLAASCSESAADVARDVYGGVATLAKDHVAASPAGIARAAEGSLRYSADSEHCSDVIASVVASEEKGGH